MNKSPPVHVTTKPSAVTKTPLNLDYINLFIEAVISTFTTMIGETPVREKVMLKGDGDEIFGVSGIVGLAGEVSGSVVLTFNEDTAMSVVGKFSGATYTSLTSDVIDGVGELTNIIAGDAKNRLRSKGYKFNIGLPKVVSGRNYITMRTKDVPCIVIKFSLPLGGLSLEVCLKKGD
jgi:chemotaxis protein CheX